MSMSQRSAITSKHALIKPAIEDLERHHPHSHSGEVVSLVAQGWRDNFIKTARYGWLRLPD